MINSSIRQRGVFTVEFAIIGLVFSLLFVFSADVIIKLSYKGKLDRLSYSLVNVLKERTQLYGKDYVLSEADVTTIVKIAKGSLRRTVSQFDKNKLGYKIEAVTFDAKENSTYSKFPAGAAVVSCNNDKSLDTMKHLSKTTTWKRRTTLYRVTLCYETSNWIGDLLGTQFTRVESDAIMIGR